MNEEEYNKDLQKIAEITQLKLRELQKNLTKEQIIEYREHFDFFWIYMIMSVVGEESLVHYFIELLNQASKFDWNKRDLKSIQEERFDKIEKEEAND